LGREEYFATLKRNWPPIFQYVGVPVSDWRNIKHCTHVLDLLAAHAGGQLSVGLRNELLHWDCVELPDKQPNGFSGSIFLEERGSLSTNIFGRVYRWRLGSRRWSQNARH
jgi:hypothetical protein